MIEATVSSVVTLVLLALVLLLVVRTVRIVPQASVYVIERLGRYSRTLEPGIHLLVPVLDKVRVRMDVREQVVAFPPQAVITKDNLVVGIDTVIYFTPTDVAAATYQIENYVAAIEQLVVTTLRNVVGGLALEEALTGRDAINSQLAAVLDEATGKWGIKVNRVEIRGIEPPATIRDAMEQAMRADRGKRAAILTAEGQQQSAILTAQGEKQAAVLRAEAAQQAAVLAAKGEKEARVLHAEGEATAIARVVEAIHAAQVDETVLAYQQLQLLPRLAEGSANKVWFVPTDVAGHVDAARRLLAGAGDAAGTSAAGSTAVANGGTPAGTPAGTVTGTPANGAGAAPAPRALPGVLPDGGAPTR